MTNVADVCRKVVENVNDGLACGIVDIQTGLLMGVHHLVLHFTPDYLDRIGKCIFPIPEVPISQG